MTQGSGSVVLRGGTVLTVDATHRVLPDTDVLVTGDRIAEIGPNLQVPEGTREIDASGGIVMPGMIDTHRHMWQTAMRGYGADWTLTQYFVWYYLESGRHFRPEDVHAGNLLAALEAVDAGVTTCVDWSHGLQTTGHADAAVDALRSVPGRFVLAYGNIQQAPVGVVDVAGLPGVRPPADRRGRRHARLPDGLRRHRRPGVPRARGLRGGPRAGRPGHHPRRRLGRDERRRHPAAPRGRVPRRDDHVRPRHDALGRLLPAHRRHRRLGLGWRPRASRAPARATRRRWALRAHGIPVSLSMDTSVWWSGDLFSAMRTTLGADRSRDHLEAHAKGNTVTNHALRAEQVVEWATLGGAKALGRESDLGSVEVGKKADLVLLKNEHSPASFPVLNPYGHVVFQAQRGDVHTVLVNGRVVKSEHRLVDVDLADARRKVEATVEHLRSTLGDEAWEKGMNPDIPETALVENPYQYSDYGGAMPGR